MNPFAPHRRYRRTLVGLLLATLAVTALALGSGRYQLNWPALWAAWPATDTVGHMVLLDLRLPRVLAALAVGACLAAAGWIFQRMSRNALASPDIIGLTTGAATGGLTVILLMGQREGAASALAVPLGTLAGGLLTVALVYLLSARRGIGGQWMILAGIAVGALLAAVNDYLLTRADLDDALAARTWLFGSLQGAGWPQVLALLALGTPLLLLAGWQARALNVLEMGDDLAAALGLPVRRARLGLLAVAVALTGLGIAAAGPIGFVALVAPQLARRLCGGASRLPAVLLTGALLCVASDWAARTALAPFQIPVGLVTSLLGGAYLAWLLAREWRS